MSNFTVLALGWGGWVQCLARIGLVRYASKMSTDYKPKDAQMLFGVSDETIRTWANQFEKFLSPLANPGKGRHRIFTYDDLSVFALVSELKSKGMTYADVTAALENGERGDVPEIPADLDMLQTTIQLDDASQKVKQLQSMIQESREQVIRLETLLNERDRQIEQLRTDRDQVAKLHEEIGRLKALLQIERERNADDD